MKSNTYEYLDRKKQHFVRRLTRRGAINSSDAAIPAHLRDNRQHEFA